MEILNLDLVSFLQVVSWCILILFAFCSIVQYNHIESNICSILYYLALRICVRRDNNFFRNWHKYSVTHAEMIKLVTATASLYTSISNGGAKHPDPTIVIPYILSLSHLSHPDHPIFPHKKISPVRASAPKVSFTLWIYMMILSPHPKIP